MSTPFNLSLNFLKNDTEELNQSGRDGSVGISAPENIDEISIVQNSDGTWSQTSNRIKSSIKKDKKARSDELIKYEDEVSAFVDLAKRTDTTVLNIQTEINNKKQQIIDLIADAVGFGCSCVVGAALTNGIVLGIGSDVVNDRGVIKKYSGLDDPTAEVPFQSDDTITINASNLGTGYATDFIINSGSVVGTYKTVYPFTAFGLPDSTCAGYASSIATLATEIDQLRGQINSSLINKTNKIKDRKTTSEVFVWGYKSRENKINKQINQNNDVLQTIENESAYQ